MKNKKYYWLKLQNDFFTQKIIKKLRKIAGGDTYTIIYLKMQLISLKDNGKLYFESVEDTFANELALSIDEDPENVQITLLFLEKHRLVEMISEDEYILPETIKNIGAEGDSAERVRKFREKQALQCNEAVTNSNTEKEQHKKQEKEKKQQHVVFPGVDDDVFLEDVENIPKVDLPPNQYADALEEGDAVSNKTDVLKEVMIQRYGVTPAIVSKWIIKYPIEYLSEKVSILETNIARGKDINLAGFLTDAIAKNYKIPTKVIKTQKQAKKDCPLCKGTGRITLVSQDLETRAEVELKKDCKCLS